VIEAAHTVAIATSIEDVWDYVRDIGNWARLFPGCQDCVIVDDHASRWTLKVGAGGMVRTVNVLVHVDRWDGPERVNFSFKLEKEPVVGSGVYTAVKRSGLETEITMAVQVAGSGQMAPMWEAMSGPLLPQMAKSFANRLKAGIEETAGIAPVVAMKSTWFARLRAWFGERYRALRGSRSRAVERAEEGIAMTEQNKAVVLRFIQAMGAGDSEAASPCLAADAFTLAKGFGKFAGVRRHDTILGTIAAFRKLFPEGLRIEIKSVTAEGDRVVVEFEGNATTLQGQAYNNQYCMVFSLAGGRISQVNEYFCTLLADQVLWPLVENMADEIPEG